MIVYRLATIDLILTKMARADEDDLQDVQFLLHQERLTMDQLNLAFDKARIPEIPEIKEFFNRAKSKVLGLVTRTNSGN